MRRALGVALLLAPLVCAAQIAPGTAEQEARAEDLGAIDSARAFLQVCGMLGQELPADAQRELSRASKAEQEQYLVVQALGTAVCAGVIQAVAETISTAKDYRTAGGTRVCVPPNLTKDQFMRDLQAIAKSEPGVVDTEGMTAAGLVLYGLHKANACR